MTWSRSRQAVVLAAAALALPGCGGGDAGARERSGPPVGDARVVAVGPRAGEVLVGASGGLFRATDDGRLALVGQAGRDVTALAAVGRTRLLGSGHPPPGVDAPPDAGLLRSSDGGRTWDPVSLAGEAELELLRPATGRLYALNATTGSLMVSGDDGRTWDVRSTPPGLSDLAVDPHNARHLLGTSPGNLWRSRDGGERWEHPDGPSGALAWMRDGRVFVAAPDARLYRSRDRGRTWQVVGRLPAPVTALAPGPYGLVGMLGDGTVLSSAGDGGPWALVARP